MSGEGIRRSDRLYVRVPIRASGTDCRNTSFVDNTQTLIISRYGAKILLNRALVPEQQVIIRCLLTGLETSARVVGQLGEEPGGIHYGIEFLDPNTNIWCIEFPSLSDSEQAAARVLLECARCHFREIAYLTEMEAEVLQINRSLTRSCKRCGAESPWSESLALEPTEQELKPETPPQRTQNERKHVRMNLKMTACIRHPQFGNEVVRSEDVSRGGFRFNSRKLYSVGGVVEVALPYSEAGMNIFSPARIVRARELQGEGIIQYGLMYIPVHKGWPEDLNIPTYKPTT